MLKYLEKKETEYMRLQRHKMGADDFEPLTMIGKGAFGEVFLVFFLLLFLIYNSVITIITWFPLFFYELVSFILYKKFSLDTVAFLFHWSFAFLTLYWRPWRGCAVTEIRRFIKLGVLVRMCSHWIRGFGNHVDIWISWLLHVGHRMLAIHEFLVI